MAAIVEATKAAFHLCLGVYEHSRDISHHMDELHNYLLYVIRAPVKALI